MMTRRGPTRTTIAALALAALSTTAAPARAEPATQGTDGEAEARTRAKLAEGFRAEPQTPAQPARRVSGPETWPEPVRAIFVGVSGGVGFANVKHPDVGRPHVLGPMLALQVGYRLSPKWRISLVYTNFQQTVARGGAGELFGATASFLRTQADCNNCRPAGIGGDVRSTTLHLGTVGPAFDVTPFGRDGLFLGASGGVAMTTVLDTSYGAAGSARVGFRLRPVENLSLALEGGVQGQVYSGGSAALGYGAAEARLNF